MDTPPDTLDLPLAAPADFWPAWAEATAEWLQDKDVSARDAIVLLPYAQLLGPARQAFARRGGWLPRIETTHSLAATLPPPARSADPATEAPTGQGAVDRLLAARLLRRETWAQAWARRDPRAFDQVVAALVETAHELLRGARARAPSDRADFWQAGREMLAPHAGPGGIERGLTRIALEWAALAEPPATDALFDLRPAAWIALVAGGPDPLTDALLVHGAGQGVPTLRATLDAGLGDDPFDAPASAPDNIPAPRLLLANDAEDEALAAATETLAALAASATDVALVAEDRQLTRRIRALLERRGIAMLDETGWTLATTRAGARVMAFLRAARPQATHDERLDWLKSTTGTADEAALRALERHWRRPERAPIDPAAAALWQRAGDQLAAFATPARRPLADWLSALVAALAPQAAADPGADADWSADPAAQAVLRALSLADPSGVTTAWRQTPMTLADFTAWCDQVLEQGSYTPPPPVGRAQVVITPMARALLRPFGAVVLPGADAIHLDAPAPAGGLLADADRRALGLPDRAERIARRAQMFAHLARAPRLVLLRRHLQDDEPLAPSALLDRLALARQRAGLPPLASQDARPAVQARPVQPVARPRPQANALPATWSATTVEALRACPYRFFAQALLRLDEDEELDREPEKRDFGTWLHATLKRYHDDRRAAPEAPHEPQALRAAAEAVAAEMGMDAAAWLPFRAALDGFVRRYLVWQAGHEAAGWRYHAGEVDLRVSPPALAGIALRGRLDRIDQRADGAWALLDYKTGSLATLKKRAGDPLEDTQLAIYAVLAADHAVAEAAYVALDERDAIDSAPHKQVTRSAEALVEGLGTDLQRLRAGEPMRALGQGDACEYCAARGLCRRDHWAAEPGADR